MKMAETLGTETKMVEKIESEVLPTEEADDTNSIEGEEPEVDEHPEQNKKLDEDLDRRNPQYIPKGGAFYEHDNRTLDVVETPETAESDKKKKIWTDSKKTERWMHDCYVEDEQGPKSTQEIIDIYGYDIRNEESAPRARRRRRYGRGPDKYERKWDDEEAYSQKGMRGRPPNRKNEQDFPPLPHQKNGQVGRAEGRGGAHHSWRDNRQPEHRDAEPRAGTAPRSHPLTQPESSQPKPRLDDSIKPFRKAQDNKEVQRGRISDTRPHPSYTEEDLRELTREVTNLNIQQKPKPKVAEHKKESPEQNRNQPSNRQNPKRYSKISSKGFYFPPESVPPPLDPRELKQMQSQMQTASLPAQSRTVQHVQQPQQQQQQQQRSDVLVMQRYPESFNGNATYLQGRSMMPLAPPMSAPPSIPQTMAPQIAGIDLPPQPGYVAAPPVYLDMVPSDVVPFQGYTYPQGQNTELYQAPAQAMPSGITYYSPEIQGTALQQRALPLRRKAAIPIVPPPDTH